MPTSSRARSTAARSALRRRPKRRAGQPAGGDDLADGGGDAAGGGGALRDVADARPVAEAAAAGCRTADSSPPVSGTWPTTARTAVDLPEPLAPSSATTSPRRTVRSTPRSTGREPSEAVAPRRDMTGCVRMRPGPWRRAGGRDGRRHASRLPAAACRHYLLPSRLLPRLLQVGPHDLEVVSALGLVGDSLERVEDVGLQAGVAGEGLGGLVAGQGLEEDRGDLLLLRDRPGAPSSGRGSARTRGRRR